VTDAIALHGVSHRFGELVVVDDVELTIAPGECFGLLGPNGAGKTTTIRLITTLLPVQQGDVTVFGKDVTTEPMAVRRRLGYVPQPWSAWTTPRTGSPRRTRAAWCGGWSWPRRW
jgi:ABC-2 type transport system ATP-binding protein